MPVNPRRNIFDVLEERGISSNNSSRPTSSGLVAAQPIKNNNSNFGSHNKPKYTTLYDLKAHPQRTLSPMPHAPGGGSAARLSHEEQLKRERRASLPANVTGGGPRRDFSPPGAPAINGLVRVTSPSAGVVETVAVVEDTSSQHDAVDVAIHQLKWAAVRFAAKTEYGALNVPSSCQHSAIMRALYLSPKELYDFTVKRYDDADEAAALHDARGHYVVGADMVAAAALSLHDPWGNMVAKVSETATNAVRCVFDDLHRPNKLQDTDHHGDGQIRDVELCAIADNSHGVNPAASSEVQGAIHWPSGTIVHRWAARKDGRDYMRAFKALASARAELLLPEWVAVPLVVSVVWGGSWYTVTWIPQLFPVVPRDELSRSAATAAANNNSNTYHAALLQLLSFALPSTLNNANNSNIIPEKRWELFGGCDDLLYVIPTVELSLSLAGRRQEYLAADAARKLHNDAQEAGGSSTGMPAETGASQLNSSQQSQRVGPSSSGFLGGSSSSSSNRPSLFNVVRSHPQRAAINDRLVPLLMHKMEWFADQAMTSAVSSSVMVRVDWLSEIFHCCGARIRTLLLVRALVYQQQQRSLPVANPSGGGPSDTWNVMDSLFLSELVARTLKTMILHHLQDHCCVVSPSCTSPVVEAPGTGNISHQLTLADGIQQSRISRRHVSVIADSSAMELARPTLEYIATALFQKLVHSPKFLSRDLIPALLDKFGMGAECEKLLLEGANFDSICLAVVIQHLEVRLGLKYRSGNMEFVLPASSADVVVAGSSARSLLSKASLLRDEVFRSDEAVQLALEVGCSFSTSAASTAIGAHLTSLYHSMIGVHNDLVSSRSVYKAAVNRGHALARSSLVSSSSSPSVALTTSQEGMNVDSEPAKMTMLFLITAMHQVIHASSSLVPSVFFKRAAQQVLVTSSSIAERIPLAVEQTVSHSSNAIVDFDQVEAFATLRFLGSLRSSIERCRSNSPDDVHNDQTTFMTMMTASLAYYWCTVALHIAKGFSSATHHQLDGEEGNSGVVNADGAGAAVMSGALGSRYSVGHWLRIIDNFLFVAESETLDDSEDHLRPPVSYRSAYRQAMSAFIHWVIEIPQEDSPVPPIQHPPEKQEQITPPQQEPKRSTPSVEHEFVLPPEAPEDHLDLPEAENILLADTDTILPEEQPMIAPRTRTPSSVCSEELRRRHDDDEEIALDEELALPIEIDPPSQPLVIAAADNAQTTVVESDPIVQQADLPTSFEVCYERPSETTIDVDRTSGRFVILPQRGPEKATQTKVLTSHNTNRNAPDGGDEVAGPRPTRFGHDYSGGASSESRPGPDTDGFDSDSSSACDSMGSSWAAFSHLGNRTDEPQSLDRSVLEQMKRRKRLLQRESTEFQLIVNQDREARHRVAAAVQRRLELTESVSADAYVPPAVRAGLENLKTELASTSTAWKRDYEQFIHDSTVAKRDAVLALSAPREATNLAMEDAFSRCQEKWRKQVSRLIADFWHTGMEVRCDVMTAVDSALSCLPSNITSPLAPWRTTSNLFGCPLWDPAVVPEMASPVGVEKLILRSADFEECDAPETTQGETMINDLPIKPVKKRALLDPISSLDSQFKIATPRALPSQTPSIHCSLPEPRERPSLFEEFLINWLQLVALFVDGTSELHHASYRFGQVCIIEVQSLEKHENMSRADVLDSETLFRRLLLRDYLTETELTLSKERMGSKKRNALFTSEKEHRLTLELDQVILRQTELLPAVEKSLRSTIENDRSAFEQAASTSEIDSRLRARATTIFLQQEAALRRSEVQARVRLTWLYDDTHKDLTTTFGQYSV